MGLGERFRPTGTRGISRFLADHEQCDAGFDVNPEQGAGSGRLRITCQGCGSSVTYRAGELPEATGLAMPEPAPNGKPTAEAPPEAVAAAPARTRRPSPPPSAPAGAGAGAAAGRKTASAPGPAAAPSWRPPARRLLWLGPPGGVRRWLPLAAIAALIVTGLVMIAVGLLRDDDGSETAAPPSEEPVAQAPAPAEPEAVQPSPAEEIDLRRRVFVQRFALGLPSGWSGGQEGGAVVAEPGDGDAAVRVFFEPGARPLGSFSRAAAGFLAAERDGARVGEPESIRHAGRPAMRVEAVFGGGRELAVVLSAGGFSYLLLQRVDRSASGSAEAEAEAVLASFEPL